ncbi:sensor histidine kinase [Nocardioides cynanchi]|uniref:sensor histidine kinase n=1 Tax=Nocardioides cynanchi TaxID=2558918 RepID=UPI0012478896|nr:HAMP domain-containing sensor histidine kinase [Nocardioides cynanchi]
MGERPEGRTRTGNGDDIRDGVDGRRDDIDRIAGGVRKTAGARAVLVSRALGTDWLEVVAAEGAAADLTELLGARWHSSDLDAGVADGEPRGSHIVTRRGTGPVALPAGSHLPEGEGGLLMPLRTRSGRLVGAISVEGVADPVGLSPVVCELLEGYAEQLRLALQHQGIEALLTEQLRLAFAAEELLHSAGQQPDLDAVLHEVSTGLTEMLDARVGWACVEIAAGVHAEAACHPPEAASRLGPDICTLIEPMVADCWRDDLTLTQQDAPLLGRLAALVDQQQALLAAVGSGNELRGALLILRGEDRPWTLAERDVVRRLGRQMATVVGHLEGRRRDRALVEELRELDAYRRELVVSITHDLKTPLTAITLNTELLASGTRPEDASHHPVDAIRRSALRLSGLVDDLLALARAEEGLIGGAHSEGDLAVVLRDACRHAEPEAQLRGIGFDVDAPAELVVPLDVDALSRVLVNLVANAVKFSLPGGRVRLSLSQVGDVVVFSCSDDGIGIPEDEQSTVFDMFSRSSDPLARGVPGSGMGLAISQRILARLGGSIEVHSVQGQGTTFVVRVPTTVPAAG